MASFQSAIPQGRACNNPKAHCFAMLSFFHKAKFMSKLIFRFMKKAFISR